MDLKVDDQTTVQPFSISYWIRLTAVYLLIPLLLLALGGDWCWWQAWIFTALIIAVGIGPRLWGELRHPGLWRNAWMQNRSRGEKSMEDKWFRLSYLASSYRDQLFRGMVEFCSLSWRFIELSLLDNKS